MEHMDTMISTVWPARGAQVKYSSEWIKQNRLFKMLFIMKIISKYRKHYLDSSVTAP